jgi:hypothetical protein
VGTAGAAEAVERLRAAQRQELFAARRALARDPRDERAHARLEEAVARSALLDAALRLGADPRLPAGPLLAQRHGRVSILPRPAFVSGGTERWLARASARVDDAERAHARQNTYDVVTRNCVTELFREIELALAGDTRSPFARRPDTAAPLAFVPFLAERAVRAQWRTGEHRTLLSYRRATVAAQMAAPGGWRALLRESNTLTSALYQPHEGDSIFLFFTDDAGLARPLLGAANLTAGLVASVAGLLRLPFDGGVTMARGLRGSAASVPELFFANVRKGTFPLAVPADARPEDG